VADAVQHRGQLNQRATIRAARWPGLGHPGRGDVTDRVDAVEAGPQHGEVHGDVAVLGEAADPDDAVIICHFVLRGATSHQPWALGLATYPADAFNDAARTLLLDAGLVDDDQLERVSGRRLVGYHERIGARLPTAHESDRLEIPASARSSRSPAPREPPPHRSPDSRSPPEPTASKSTT
jgi:hypothetical protein